MKKVLLPVIAVLLLGIGTTLIIKPNLISSFSGGIPERVVILRETSLSQPLSQEMVILFAKAPEIGVAVWDDDVLGPDKKPSEEAKPFLDAYTASGKELPVVVLKWSSNTYTVVACPTKLDELQKLTGKVTIK
jgi:hypothetical protein